MVNLFDIGNVVGIVMTILTAVTAYLYGLTGRPTSLAESKRQKRIQIWSYVFSVTTVVVLILTVFYASVQGMSTIVPAILTFVFLGSFVGALITGTVIGSRRRSAASDDENKMSA